MAIYKLLCSCLLTTKFKTKTIMLAHFLKLKAFEEAQFANFYRMKLLQLMYTRPIKYMYTSQTAADISLCSSPLYNLLALLTKMAINFVDT